MSPKTLPSLLGVDGGGTSTVAWLADDRGEVIGRGKAGPSNAKAIGVEAARAALDEAIRRAFTDAGCAVTPVAVACFGLAGFDRAEDKRLLEDWSLAADRARRLLLVNDGELVLAAGTPGGNGVAIIAGTGSIAVGKAADGRSARAGGWGHLFGDEGSAYSVALSGLRLAAQRHDGREPRCGGPTADSDALTERLCQAIGVRGPSEFVTAIYSERFDRTRIAGLAPVVAALADEDPEILRGILEPAGRELARAVLAVAATLEWREPELPLAMAGGFLLSTPQVSAAMLAHLRDRSGCTVLPSPVPDPVRGALVLAHRAFVP